MIPPLMLGLDSDDGATIQPGSISDWVLWHYVDNPAPCKCRVAVGRLDIEMRQPPIMPY